MNAIPHPGSTVLIVGGTGRLGRILVRRFSANGWNVSVLTRNLSEARSFFRDLPKVVFIEADLSQPSSLTHVCQGCDLTIFAAGARRPAYATDHHSQLDFQKLNTEALRYLGQSALDAGNHPFLHLGSLFAIGLGGTGAISEETSPDPSTPFGTSELGGELELLELHQRFGMDCRILRLPPVTGSSARGGLLDALRIAATDKAWAEKFILYKDTTKPFLAIADFCSALDATLELGVAGRIYHFSSGDFRLAEIASRLETLAFFDQPLLEFMSSYQNRSKDLDGFLRQYLRWNVQVPIGRAKTELFWNPIAVRAEDLFTVTR